MLVYDIKVAASMMCPSDSLIPPILPPIPLYNSSEFAQNLCASELGGVLRLLGNED